MAVESLNINPDKPMNYKLTIHCCCGYLKEASQCVPNHMFKLKAKKIITI